MNRAGKIFRARSIVLQLRWRPRLGVIDPDPKVDADKTQHGALLVYGNETTGKWSVMPALLPPDFNAKAVLRIAGLS